MRAGLAQGTNSFAIAFLLLVLNSDTFTWILQVAHRLLRGMKGEGRRDAVTQLRAAHAVLLAAVVFLGALGSCRAATKSVSLKTSLSCGRWRKTSVASRTWRTGGVGRYWVQASFFMNFFPFISPFPSPFLQACVLGCPI